jgi:hypothetical protein
LRTSTEPRRQSTSLLEVHLDYAKHPRQDFVDSHVTVKKAVYEQSATSVQPPIKPGYYDVHESIFSGIVLELAKTEDLSRHLWKQHTSGRASPDEVLLHHWADQAAEALEFAHSLGVYNSDIDCLNFSLDDQLNLEVANQTPASIDGSLQSLS